MSKNLPILIIGFGSIGQRHYRNLSKLGFSNVYVYDIDKEKIADKKLKTVKKINLKESKQFDVAFICNPNNWHIKTAIQCAQAGCHLFIEKPLSHNLNGIKRLLRICQNKKLINMVGCNMHFHPCLRFIKDYLEKGKLGKVYSISHEFGSYLPYWRPNQDYKKNYAAKKATGGGIILDDIHEFDLLFWLNNYEKVIESKFIFDKVSDLKIETEDICIASFKFNNKVLGLVKCDYLQQNYRRSCKVVGARGSLEWNFNKNIVWLYTRQRSKKLFEVKNYNINNMYINEIKYFFNNIDKKQQTFNDIKTAASVLKYCINRI